MAIDMIVKVEVEGMMMINVISAYAPQVGCEMEEKERFWSELDDVVDGVPRQERLVIGADFNGHVGEGNRGDEEVMGRYGLKERNVEGQMLVDFAKRMEMAVVKTYFKKKEDLRVTYKSGGRCTQVDYVLCRRCNLKEIGDCKVLAEDSVAIQHRMVVCRMVVEAKKKRRRVRTELRIRWWKLKEEECRVKRVAARKVLGVTSGNRKVDKETWWWNKEVQESIWRKRLAKQKWDRQSDEKSRQEYKEMRQQVKRDVAKAKEKAYEELYERFNTKGGEKDLYRLARQRDRAGKDVLQVRAINDGDGVLRKWREYFEQQMNEENQRERRLDDVELVKQDVDRISKEEVRAAIRRMKSDDIPVEAWRCLGEMGVEFLTRLFNKILEGGRMPEEWRRSVLVPIFKHKGDVQTCSNYRGIKLISHTMKLWERVVEARSPADDVTSQKPIGQITHVVQSAVTQGRSHSVSTQLEFLKGNSTTDALFALRMLMEKYREGQKELHFVFVDLEKAYDRVLREELWYCMKKSGVSENYVMVVQDMYEDSVTAVKCAVVVMDRLTDEGRQESPWTMMFAYDIVICGESSEQVEKSLERWKYALERRGMEVSRSNTEYMCVNEREGSGVVRLQGEKVEKVEEFRYLMSTVQSNGECVREVKKRVQAGWSGWRRVTGVICDSRVSARMKGKVYRTVVRPEMLYGLETVALSKRQEVELEVAELKMLKFLLGVTRTDNIRNDSIRGRTHVGCFGDKNELKRYKKLLSPDYPACSEREVEDEEDQSSVREGVLKITLHFLKNMKHTDLANTLQNKLVSVYQRKKLKSKLREKCKRITEGISQHGSSALLNEIYTDLYITEGWSGDVNNEHEVRQIETVSRRPAAQETPIKCNDLFQDKSIRSVLTKGVAGIGKTVSVQKFILDWAEGKANQDVNFMFPLPFRELNLMKQKHLSLMDLLHHFFSEIKELRLIDCERNKVVLIFDGLDECRLPLNFQNDERLCDVTESASVDVLLTNLIKGNLLPSALLWITSRPAAANQIPPESVDQVTEIRGFSDPQKEEYFRKRISDQSLANNIITHMKSSRSLYIMCHIPVFCWISATVLEKMLADQKSILSLGKLAFQQLEKGNLIFYEEDLRECGIDVREVSVYSGVCTQIFRKEFRLHLGKVFSFVHLSVQEFLAALYTFLSFINKKSKKLQINNLSDLFTKSNMSDFLRSAVKKALQSENGHLDLFLRFLLGLSLESNQTLLRDLLPQTESSSHSKQETVEYIKEMIRENPSPEKSINLFHCLNELNDDSLVQEVQRYLNSRDSWCLSGVRLSPAQWSALVFVLLNSEENLDVFDLSKYDRSDECLLRLLPVVKASRKAE
ncbi:NACHT, LRR and PYD domains-containing protein 12 isoform X3 [Silurus meridionalis]|nr:NACHT, LRR and PYD domains-containing protein 12 isoform X3 [Silurus meridionalis]